MNVACLECWQCRENAVNDWVGRNIAESKTAKAATAFTLTYGRDRQKGSPFYGMVDHPRAKVLTYSDVQKMFKMLRRQTEQNPDGFPMRYFVVGEYGAANGRSHWHGMMYWLGDVPEHPLRKNFRNKFWPHGFQFWDKPTPAAVRYACKYIQKDIGVAERQGHLMMSKKPLLGAEYFMQRAEQHVHQGIAPQDLFYGWWDVTRLDRYGYDKPIKFMMKRAAKDLFLAHFVRVWEATYPDTDMPLSELVEEWLDSQVDLDGLKAKWALEDAQKAATQQRLRGGGRWSLYDDGEWTNAYVSRKDLSEEDKQAELQAYIQRKASQNGETRKGT